jgi:uncharacterized protein (UPF0261 family)
MSHITNIEETLAYELIVQATDRLSQHLHEEDWDAAIVGALIRAVEIASGRKVRSIEQVFVMKGKK